MVVLEALIVFVLLIAEFGVGMDAPFLPESGDAEGPSDAKEQHRPHREAAKSSFQVHCLVVPAKPDLSRGEKLHGGIKGGETF